ncbi:MULTISPECIES: helix-turn-helix domain-containing protein [Arthrobacter]|nr:MULTISPECIES: helix-turn-helix domain-containing protein [Arthrobacter]
MAGDKLTQTARILRLLKTKGKVSNFELRKIAWRYPARVLDLKHEGHKIRSVHDTGAKWFYIYDGDEDDGKEAA